MIRRFCDICDTEVDSDQLAGDVLWRRNGGDVVIRVEVKYSRPNHAEVDICRGCLIDSVKRLDARPRAEDD